MRETEPIECVAIGNTSRQNEPVVFGDITTERIAGIYGLLCRPTGKWYIGQSRNIRERESYYRKLDCKRQPKIYNAIKKYGYENFDTFVIEKCDAVDWILDYREMFWIRHFDSLYRGYNCTIGGGGSSGRIMSISSKMKVSASRTGKYCGEKNHNFGKSLSADVKQKISDAKTGKFCGKDNANFGNKFSHTDAAKEKIRMATILMWKKRKDAHAVIGT